MNFSYYIASRILGKNNTTKNISKPIIKIGVIGIALGVAVMILTIAIITGFQEQITNKVTTFTSHLRINDFNENQSFESNPIYINDSLLNTIKLNSNVSHIQAFSTKNGILKTKTENEGVVLKGVSSHYDWSYLKPYITEGSVLNITENSVSKDIFISAGLAKKLSLKLNQKLLIYFMTKKKLEDTTASGQNYINYEPRVRDFYIKGIFNTGFGDFDKNLAYIDMKQIQKLNYWDSTQVGGYEIYLKNYLLMDETCNELNDEIGYNYKTQTAKQLQPNIFSWLEVINVNAIIIVTLMILVAGINMISALLILILEKTNLVGILKSLGLTNTNTRKIFLFISFKLLVKGLIYGNIIGVGLCLLQYHFKFASLDTETYYLSHVPINLSFTNVILINIGTIIACIGMMFIPTLILNKITPIKAIRFS